MYNGLPSASSSVAATHTHTALSGKPCKAAIIPLLVIHVPALHDGKDFLRDDIPDQAAGILRRVAECHQPREGTLCFRWRIVLHLLINHGQDRFR
jgi:hypothetical protein